MRTRTLNNPTETAGTVSEKNFQSLQPLTPGSKSFLLQHDFPAVTFIRPLVHGYSLLRTQLNNDYFLDLFDKALEFQVPIEGHRESTLYSLWSLNWLTDEPKIRKRAQVSSRRH